VKKILRIAVYGVLSLILLAFLIAGATQTQFFRDELRSLALARLDSLLVADVHMGVIRGNLVTGFSVDSVSVSVDGVPAASIARINLRYNLFSIPGRTISIGTITLVHPEIHMVRGLDSIWNVKKIVRPTNDEEPAKPFKWSILINRLEIQGGRFILTDSLAMAERPPLDSLREHLHNFSVNNIDLVLKAAISPENKHVVITALRGVCASPQINLHQLSGEFTILRNEVSVRDLRIVTDRSSLALTAEMDRVDLLGGLTIGQLEHSPVRLELRGTPIDLAELQQLLPPLEFLRGTTSLDLGVSGEFGRLKIDRLDLSTGRSQMYWTGMLTHLHRPGDLALDVKLSEGRIHPGDLPVLMPLFHLPDFGSLGMTTLNLEFVGKPDDFKTKVELETTAGTIRTEMAMKIGGASTLEYEGSIAAEHVNPAPIVGDSVLSGSLNWNAVIAGKGVDLGNLASTLDLTIEPSEFRGLTVAPSHVHAEGFNRVLTVNGTLSLGGMTSSLAVKLDQHDKTLPTVALDADVSSLNLADILHNKEFDSDLTLRLLLHGQGASWSTVGGEAALTFSSSRYRDYQIDSSDITLSLDQSVPRHKQLSLESNIADFSLTGAYNLSFVSRLLGYEIQNVRMAVGDRLKTLDSSFIPVIDQQAFRLAGQDLAKEADTIDAEYALQIKDLEPVSVVAGDRRFQGSGTMRGTLRGTYQSLNLDGDLDAKYFVYGNVERGVLLKNTDVTFDLRNLHPVKPMSSASLQLNAKAEEIHINREILDSLAVNVKYGNEFARYSMHTVSDSVVLVDLRGTAKVTEAGIAAAVDSIQLGYRGLVWKNDTSALVAVTSSDVSVHGLSLNHDSSRVRGDARLGPAGAFDAHFSGRRLNLGDLKYFLSTEESGVRGAAFRGSADFDLLGSGTLESPVVRGTLHARDVSFRRVPFGRLDADCSYADTTLHIALQGGKETRGDTLLPSLVIQGAIPLNLSSTATGNRLLEGPISLDIASDGTQLSVLDPLLPSFNELTGFLRCKLLVSGTARHPLYSGSMALENCGFLFVPNNIHYTMDASFEPQGDRIKVVDALIRNVPSDQRSGKKGEVHITGDFLFRDFIPGDFNLNATGALLVVKETSRLTSLSLYGNLFAEFGDGGLQFTGNIDNSLLRGSVIITNSSLVFPPTQTVAEDKTPLSIPVVYVDDTAKAIAREEPSELSAYFGTDSSKGVISSLVEVDSSRSFTEGIHYDLDIEPSGGNTQITMIFNSLTNEELVADIDGKFRVTGDGREWFGDLTVSRAYYNFFKRFDAEGSLHFAGSVLNPELNITATYAGQRTISDSTGQVTENIVVKNVLTGTRLKPKAEISMTIQGEDYDTYNGLKSNDVQKDAIQFVIYGTFPLTAAQRGTAQEDILSTIRGSVTNISAGLLTGALSDYLRNETNSVIREVGIDVGQKQTDLRLSGIAWEGLWQYKGNVLEDPLGNANFSILYSFGSIFNNPSLRNLMFELERKVETNTLSPTNELKRTNSARLFYRFSF
jgi:hypothetical protein